MIFWVSVDKLNCEETRKNILEKVEEDTGLVFGGFISSTDEEQGEVIQQLEPLFVGKTFLWLQFPTVLAEGPILYKINEETSDSIRFQSLPLYLGNDARSCFGFSQSPMPVESAVLFDHRS